MTGGWFRRRRHLWIELLQCHAARRRDTAAVGDQAAGDAIAIWNELRADGQGVVHASLLIFLRSGAGRRGRGCNATRRDRNSDAGVPHLCDRVFHLTLPSVCELRCRHSREVNFIAPLRESMVKKGGGLPDLYEGSETSIANDWSASGPIPTNGTPNHFNNWC